jgi:hypothetical protein
MHSVVLSCETIVEVATDMLVALECGWKMSNGKGCGAVLGSWCLLKKVGTYRALIASQTDLFISIS